MLQSLPGTGRTVEPGISRRALLLASPAVLAIAATPVLGALPSADTLDHLIEAHEAAYTAYNNACSRTMEVQDRLRHQKRIEAAILVYPDGSEGERREVGPFSLPDIHNAIEARHAELRRIHCGPWSRRMAPDHVAQLENELVASQERALASLSEAIAEQERREVEAGLPALERASEAAGEVEQQARLDLLLYRPRNAVEAQRKDEYIGGSVPFIESWYGDDDFVTALINRLGEVA